MTPEMMLNTAFWAQGQNSYQEAEESIMRAHQCKRAEKSRPVLSGKLQEIAQ